jgi:hypothetical protein
LSLTEVNLIGNDGQTPLHLAAGSLEIEQCTEEDTNHGNVSKEVNYN